MKISAIAVRKTPQSNAGIQVFPSNKTWTYQFCGLGAACSIDSGQATATRGRLVRREALEVALYTFKFVPAIDSVVAFMPPPPGQTTTTLLFLQKSNLKDQLSLPLSKTLTLRRAAAADRSRHGRGGDDRQADAAHGLLVHAHPAPGRQRGADPRSGRDVGSRPPSGSSALHPRSAVPRPSGLQATLGVSLDELEHAPPGVVRRVGVLLELAVEEAVRGAVVGDDLVLDAGRGRAPRRRRRSARR